MLIILLICCIIYVDPPGSPWGPVGRLISLPFLITQFGSSFRFSTNCLRRATSSSRCSLVMSGVMKIDFVLKQLLDDCLIFGPHLIALSLALESTNFTRTGLLFPSCLFFPKRSTLSTWALAPMLPSTSCMCSLTFKIRSQWVTNGSI